MKTLRAWLSSILALALIAGSFGMATARPRGFDSVSGDSGSIVDSVLGVVAICHQPTTGDTGSDSGGSGDTCRLCAICTALATIAIAGIVLLIALLAPTFVRIGCPTADRPAITVWPPGGIGSRAPPLVSA